MDAVDFLLTFLDLLSGFSAVMIGLLFVTVKSRNTIANIFLTIFLWSLAWIILTDILFDVQESEFLELPVILRFDPSLIIFPSLFLYILMTINSTFNKWLFLLFVPGILINIPLFDSENELLEIFGFLALPLINLPLLFFAMVTLKRHRQRVTDYYSELDYKTLSWIKVILVTVLILHIFILFGDFTDQLGDPIATISMFLESVITFFMVYWVGYNGFFQRHLGLQIGRVIDELKAIAVKQNSKTDDESKMRFKEIALDIKTRKLFQNPKLTLGTLASSLDIKEKELSRLINQNAKTNFYNFINRYRVDEFKKLMASPKAKQLSILGLAEEAGFSSKSTFYAAFKTLEGTTPKEYEMTQLVSE